MVNNNEILTIIELAEYLKITERTIYGWAQDGVIPAYKMAGSWRFRRSDIDRWLETTRTGPTLESLNSDYRVASSPPVSPTVAAVELKREKELLISKCIAAIKSDLRDRSRNEWGISRFSQFEYSIINEAVRRLKNEKLIRTKKIQSETTIIRR